jgi:hypothetical protein
MGTNGAIQHYYDYGQYEGMTYHVELCPAVYWTDPINNDAWLAYLESQQVRP